VDFRIREQSLSSREILLVIYFFLVICCQIPNDENL
jgi:hypothetical protein